jgi:hypothetical protein
MVVRLFKRLDDLFPGKVKARKLVLFVDDIARDEKNYSPEFALWCQKLSGLTKKQFAYGVDLLEGRCADKYLADEDNWPPTYADFIGLCTSLHETKAHKPFDRSRALEDLTTKSRRKRHGQQCMAVIKAMF